METTEKPKTNFFTTYWSIISAAFILTFTIGGLYSKIETQSNEIQHLKALYEAHKKEAEISHNQLLDKQERKWGDIPEIEQRVDDLEEWKSFVEGQQSIKK